MLDKNKPVTNYDFNSVTCRLLETGIKIKQHKEIFILLNGFWAITSFTGHLKNFIFPFWNSNSFFLFCFLWFFNSQVDQTLVSQSMVENLTRNIHKNDPFPKDSCNSVFNCFQNRFKIKLHSDLEKAFKWIKILIRI